MPRLTRSSEFLVNLKLLERRGSEPLAVSRRGAIEGIASSSSRLPDGAEVSVDAVLESVHGGVLVTGTVTAPWIGECARCLEMARGTVLADVRELFEKGGGPEDMTYPLGGETLDLEPMAREQCMLGLPLRPLCSPGCRGLCPRCGANLNDGPCGCPEEKDPRWSALEPLLGEDGQI